MKGHSSDEGSRPRIPLLIQVARVVLPVGLQFGSFVPLWYFAFALASAFDFREDVPIRDQPLGWLWLALYIAEAILLQVAGFASGGLLIALIAHHGSGRSWAMLIEEGMFPRALARWLPGLKAGPTSREEGQSEQDLMYDPELDVVSRLESNPAH